MPIDERNRPETHDAKGVLAGDRGDAKTEPSEARDDPMKAGEDARRLRGQVARKAEINPSSPAETGTTPGTNG